MTTNCINYQNNKMAFLPIRSLLKTGFGLMAVLLLFLPVVASGDNNPGPIALRAERLPFTPKEFYIAGIVDERKETSAVAWLLPSGTATATPKLLALDLQGGARAALQNFVKKSLPANTALRPVIIRLKECRIMEAPGEEGIAEGRVVLSMSFELQGAEEAIHLVDYKGGLRYRRSASQHGLVEPALRKALVSSLEYLHNWMDREAPTNVKLARGVKVFFTDYTRNVEDDTVFYTPERPLQWEDFRGKPRSHKYSASVYPSFAYQGDSEVVDGYVHLYLNMKVFMLKSSSWVKDEVRNSYGLNHEQRHFDIVKLVVERFKKKIQSLELSPYDYDGVIGYEYIEAYREMNRMQEAYDTETSHGMNKGAQERWNRSIAGELNGFAE
jgi:hypothetical protein